MVKINSTTSLAVLLLAAIAGTTNAFVQPSSNVIHARTVPKGPSDAFKLRDIGDPTGFDSFSRAKDVAEMTKMPVGEAQRPFRRTVYSHDDWKKHRSQDRFFYYLFAIFKSGVYQNLTREVGFVTFIAASVCAWNCAVGGYTDFDGVQQAALLADLPKIGLPMTAFTLTSPSLGLLLGMFVSLYFLGTKSSLNEFELFKSRLKALPRLLYLHNINDLHYCHSLTLAF